MWPSYPLQLDGVHTDVDDGAGVGAALTGDGAVGSDVAGATVGEKVSSASVGGSVLGSDVGCEVGSNVGATVDGAKVGDVLIGDDVVGTRVGAGVGSVWSVGQARWATYDATVPPPACSSDLAASAEAKPAWLPEPFASQPSTIWPHRSCKTGPP